MLSLIREEDVVDLAKKLIAIPSPTESEKQVTFLIAERLRAEGFEIEIQEVSPGRPQVVARLRGEGGGRSFMLNGHMDNDSLTADWKQDPYQPTVEGNRLWGAGAHNMKGGLASMLSAAIAVKRSGVALRGDLVVACVVGELQGGKGTLHLLRSGIKTDLAVIPEPYSTDVIITKCVGVHKCAITVYGRSIHTGRSESGVDAIQKMLKAIDALKDLDLPVHEPDIPNLPKLLVASIIGGRGEAYDLAGPSNLADKCTVIIDLRYAGDWTPRQIDERFVALLEKIKSEDADFRYEYHHPPPPMFRVGGIDMPPMNGTLSQEVAIIVQDAHARITGTRITRVGAVLPYSYAGNDTAHLERAGIPCCLYGPRGYADDVEKHVRIDEMMTCARVLALVALGVCR